MPCFYTLCPKHPECGHTDASQCSSANPKPAFKRLATVMLAAVLPLSIAGLTIATAIASTAPCAHAGQCGECWNTGRAGVNTWRGNVSDCDVCEKVKPDLTIASNHDGIPKTVPTGKQ